MTRDLRAIVVLMVCVSISICASASASDLTEVSTGNTGGGTAFSIAQPTLNINHFVPLTGIFPSMDTGVAPGVMTMGYVRSFGGNFAPGSSLLAQGQPQLIASNSALSTIGMKSLGSTTCRSLMLSPTKATSKLKASRSTGYRAAKCTAFAAGSACPSRKAPSLTP